MVFSICLYPTLLVFLLIATGIVLYIFRKMRGDFDTCAYLALSLSNHVFIFIARCKGVVVTCLYLAFPVEDENGVVLTCFCTAGFPSVMSFYLSQAEVGLV